MKKNLEGGQTMIKYYPHVVLFDETKQSGIGIITGWKNPTLILNKLSKESQAKIISIGPLYTTTGINFIIANLFLNPQITHLILLEDSFVDNTLSTSIKEFLSFLKTKEMPFQKKFSFDEASLQEFCNYYKKHFSICQTNQLNETISKITYPTQWRATISSFQEEQTCTDNSRLNSEKIGFNIRATTVKEAWERSLKMISTYGHLKPSDYDEFQLELMNLSIVVKAEDLNHPSMEGLIGITKEEIEKYAKGLLSKTKPDDIQYTYGSRFRDYEKIDQFEYLVKTLTEKKYSRRAVATLWNPTIETKEQEVPCLNLYQAIVQDNKLYLLAYIRANDMYNGYPRNIYGILYIQEALCKRLGLEKGYVCTTAGSAHVYERNFNDIHPYATGENKVTFCEEDERGYFVIETKDNKIVVSFYQTNGILQRQFEGTTATELRDACCFLCSSKEHAFYLAQELVKAEYALKLNLSYIQDQNLKLTASTKPKKLSRTLES